MPRAIRTEAAANIALANTVQAPHRAPKPAPKGRGLRATTVLKIVGVLVLGCLAYPYVMGV